MLNFANQFFLGFVNNFLYVLLAHFSLLFVFLRYYAIWKDIYKAHSLLRLQGVSILSVSAPTFFSVFSLLEIESVSILTVSAPTENFSLYLLAWPRCISSRVCHLPEKNVYATNISPFFNNSISLFSFFRFLFVDIILSLWFHSTAGSWFSTSFSRHFINNNL